MLSRRQMRVPPAHACILPQQTTPSKQFRRKTAAKAKMELTSQENEVP